MTAQPNTTELPQREQAANLFAALQAAYDRRARPTLTVVSDPADLGVGPIITINERRPAGDPLTATCRICGWTHVGEFFERVHREGRAHQRTHTHPATPSTRIVAPDSRGPMTAGRAWGRPDNSERRIADAEHLADYGDHTDAPDHWEP